MFNVSQTVGSILTEYSFGASFQARLAAQGLAEGFAAAIKTSHLKGPRQLSFCLAAPGAVVYARPPRAPLRGARVFVSRQTTCFDAPQVRPPSLGNGLAERRGLSDACWVARFAAKPLAAKALGRLL